MKKRRIEIAVLAALILFAAADRPSFDFGTNAYQIGALEPQRIAGVRDLGVIAVKLLIDWIG